MPQRSKLTPERTNTFLQAIELGSTIDLAAQAAGWSRALAHAYLAQGRHARTTLEEGGTITADDRRKLDFLDAYEKAEGTMARAALASIVRAAQDRRHWTAAAWLLERRFPETYGRRMVEVVGKDGGPVEIDVAASELLAELRALSGREAYTPNGAGRIRGGDVYTPENGSQPALPPAPEDG